MVNKSAKALKEYANNTCTALVDKDHWVNRLQLTDEHQEHVKQLMELSPGACNYCGNPAPLHHHIACEDHVACEKCAEHNETICSRRDSTKCKLCSKTVHFPLPKCNFFNKIEQGIAEVLQQQEHAFQMEFNRRNQDEPKKIGRPRGPRSEEQKQRSRDKRAQNKIHKTYIEKYPRALKLLCKSHKSIITLSKAIDNIAADFPELDMDVYLRPEYLNEIDIDDFMDDVEDLVSDYDEED